MTRPGTEEQYLGRSVFAPTNTFPASRGLKSGIGRLFQNQEATRRQMLWKKIAVEKFRSEIAIVQIFAIGRVCEYQIERTGSNRAPEEREYILTYDGSGEMRLPKIVGNCT